MRSTTILGAQEDNIKMQLTERNALPNKLFKDAYSNKLFVLNKVSLSNKPKRLLKARD